MKIYDIVKDAQGTLYMVSSILWGRHNIHPQVCCVRLWDRKHLTLSIRELEEWIDCNKEGIGKLS